MEDLKSKLAIQKTESHQRNKDMEALVGPTGQQKKLLRDETMLGSETKTSTKKRH